MSVQVKNRAEAERYLRMLAKQMHLANWHIEVLSELPEDDDAEAEISTTEDIRAYVKIGEKLFEYEPSRQRAILVHELAHLLVSRFKQVAWSFIEMLKGKRVQELAEAQLTLADENLAETLSLILSPMLPLPGDEPFFDARGEE